MRFELATLPFFHYNDVVVHTTNGKKGRVVGYKITQPRNSEQLLAKCHVQYEQQYSATWVHATNLRHSDDAPIFYLEPQLKQKE
jgi:hypothetical protein